MQRRNKNIRKACDEIDFIAKKWIYDSKITDALIKLTNRIKRTTWRGDYKSKSNICLSRNLSKRLNTNQTTTAKQDVSTIPYY